MKLVAANDFYNTPIFGITFTDADREDKYFRHERHIHKGFRFAIGAPDAPYDQLQPKQKELVGLLLKHKLAVTDDDANAKLGIIKRIDAEAAAELKSRQADVAAAKAAAAISLPNIMARMAQLMDQNSQLMAALAGKK